MSIRAYRINFIYDETDLTVLIRTNESEKEIIDTLKAWKDYLYEHIDSDSWKYACDIDYYQERLKYHTNWEQVPEEVDEVINFNY